MKSKISHLNSEGKAAMVDVSEKMDSPRTALAAGEVVFPPETWDYLQKGNWISSKGSILEIAKIAGIQGAKITAQLIPLCHSLPIHWVDIQMKLVQNTIQIEAQVKTVGKTGVEMEALTAVSTAALTIYDMCKALSHAIQIKEIRLVSKTGGKSDLIL